MDMETNYSTIDDLMTLTVQHNHPCRTSMKQHNAEWWIIYWRYCTPYTDTVRTFIYNVLPSSILCVCLVLLCSGSVRWVKLLWSAAFTMKHFCSDLHGTNRYIWSLRIGGPFKQVIWHRISATGTSSSNWEVVAVNSYHYRQFRDIFLLNVCAIGWAHWHGVSFILYLVCNTAHKSEARHL